MTREALIVYGLVLALALSLVYTRVTTRSLYLQLQALQQQRDDFNVEWGRLLLQEARYAEPRYIEKVARQKLGMVFPVREKISVIQLP
ncbi:MAG: cell division protein FtsL [Gammaproteobacteria bacterium]|nr:cell division protein FtsL [Gammaproteobacteria bacterium]MDX2486208.1 cell division protein FtsL [Gammaproteobacteria bacterium]